METSKSVRNIINAVKYKYGHPDIDNQKLCSLELKDGSIYFITLFRKRNFAKIDGLAIKNILVEDATTFEKRVTIARLALVGIFAFGIKKKQKNEIAYLTLEWNNAGFDHSTIIEFNGFNALNHANKTRNKILKEIKSFEQIV